MCIGLVGNFVFYVKYLSVENTRTAKCYESFNFNHGNFKLTEVEIKRHNNNYITCLMCFFHIDIQIILYIVEMENSK